MLEILEEYKPTIIKFMPPMALLILLIGLFYPMPNGSKLLVGLIFGSVGAILIPFHRTWNENAEELKFNYTYLMPIATAVFFAVIGAIEGFDIAIVLVSQTWTPYILYVAGILLAYGGKGMFVGFKNNLSFLERLWLKLQGLEMVIMPLEEVEKSSTDSPEPDETKPRY